MTDHLLSFVRELIEQVRSYSKPSLVGLLDLTLTASLALLNIIHRNVFVCFANLFSSHGGS